MPAAAAVAAVVVVVVAAAAAAKAKAKGAVTAVPLDYPDEDGDCDLFAIASGVEPAEPPPAAPEEPPKPCSSHAARAVWFASAESAAQLLDEAEEHWGPCHFLLCALKVDSWWVVLVVEAGVL